MENNKTNADPLTPEEKKDEMVPLSMLQDMMDEIKELKKGQVELAKKGDKTDEEPEKVQGDTMRLLEYTNQLVVSFNEERGTWKKYDKERREDKIYMEVMLQDKDKKQTKIEVDYMDLMQEGKLVDCEVTDTKVTPIEDKGKLIRTREVRDYKTVETRNKVRQVVKSQDVLVSLKVPAPYNTEVVLNTKYVNIK